MTTVPHRVSRTPSPRRPSDNGAAQTAELTAQRRDITVALRTLSSDEILSVLREIQPQVDALRGSVSGVRNDQAGSSNGQRTPSAERPSRNASTQPQPLVNGHTLARNSPSPQRAASLTREASGVNVQRSMQSLVLSPADTDPPASLPAGRLNNAQTQLAMLGRRINTLPPPAFSSAFQYGSAQQQTATSGLSVGVRSASPPTRTTASRSSSQGPTTTGSSAVNGTRTPFNGALTPPRNASPARISGSSSSATNQAHQTAAPVVNDAELRLMSVAALGGIFAAPGNVGRVDGRSSRSPYVNGATGTQGRSRSRGRGSGSSQSSQTSSVSSRAGSQPGNGRS